MSNLPDDFNQAAWDSHYGVRTEAEERDADNANAALDWIESLPKQIELLFIAGASKYNLNATKADCADAMGFVEDAIGDLFGKDWKQLQEIAGQRFKPLPNPAMRGFSLRSALAKNGGGL